MAWQHLYLVLWLVACVSASITSDKCKSGEVTPHFLTDIIQVPNHYCKCTASELGTLRYRDDKKGLQICNGRDFVSVCGEKGSQRTKLGTKEYPVHSCRYLHEVDSLATNGIYYIRAGSVTTRAYCIMEPICGESGWTMVMKIDGSKRTFHYDSAYWSNRNEYNTAAVNDGLNGNSETKLLTYSALPFSKLCLGMRTGASTTPRWLPITLPHRVDSLYSVIAPNKLVPTKLGRDTWKALIPESSLQRNCNQEGFNTAGTFRGTARARIGIVGNNENECLSPDSRIGVGTAGRWCGQRDHHSAGNEAKCGADKGDRSTTGIGFIFIL